MTNILIYFDEYLPLPLPRDNVITLIVSAATLHQLQQRSATFEVLWVLNIVKWNVTFSGRNFVWLTIIVPRLT